MRTPASNPFVPGSDHVPVIWAGREAEIADFASVVRPRRTQGVYERGRMVLGEPGIGKSVLVNRIAEEAADAGDWVLPAIRLDGGADPVAAATSVVTEVARSRGLDRPRGLLGRIEGVSLPVIGGGVDLRSADPADEPTRHLTRLLLAISHAAFSVEPRRLVLVRFDEVQHLRGTALSRLLTVLGDVLAAVADRRDRAGTVHREVLPIAVYLSGLPEFVQRVTDARTTFARRYRIHELEALQGAAMRLALRPFTTEGWPPGPVRMSDEAVEVIVAGSHGSPFLFQLLGEAAWNAGTGDLITAEEAERGRLSASREMQRYVRLRLADLTELQLQYLQAAADLDPSARTAARIAAAQGRSSRDLGSTARALEDRYRLIRREAGLVRFTSPGLEPYLRGELV